MLGKYASSKLQQLATESEMDRRAQENIRRRFEQNQRDSTITLLSLLPALAELLLMSPELDVESLTIKLKGIAATKKSSTTEGEDANTGRQMKLELWRELKIKSVARSMAAVYSVCMLALLLRIQLNLVGRHTYLYNTEAQCQLSFDTEQKYLCLSWYLLNNGANDLMDRVQECSTRVLDGMELNRQLSAEAFESEVVGGIRAAVEETPLVDYVLPPREQEAHCIRSGLVQSPADDDGSPIVIPISEELQQLLDETREIMHRQVLLVLFMSLMYYSEEYKAAEAKVFQLAFKRLSDSITTALFPNANGESAKTKPLASFLPETTRAAHSVLASYPNEYAQVRRPCLRIIA